MLALCDLKAGTMSEKYEHLILSPKDAKLISLCIFLYGVIVLIVKFTVDGGRPVTELLTFSMIPAVTGFSVYDFLRCKEIAVGNGGRLEHNDDEWNIIARCFWIFFWVVFTLTMPFWV